MSLSGNDTTAIVVRLQADHKRLTRDLRKAERQLERHKSQSGRILKGIGGQLAATFAVGTIASFGLEITKLAGKTENVRLAFDKLKDAPVLLERMKAATAGTVSELELMQNAVKASNFGISMESLPKLLEFASIRAAQTGESVDYLVDSIVTGIGRKSIMILDNLGISAVALKEKMNGAAVASASIGDVAKAVGEIAEEELGKMGTAAENAGVKIERLGAKWEDVKAKLGSTLESGGIMGAGLDLAAAGLDNPLAVLGVLMGAGATAGPKGYLDLLKGIADAQKQMAHNAAPMGPFQQLMDIPKLQKVKTEVKEIAKEVRKITNPGSISTVGSDMTAPEANYTAAQALGLPTPDEMRAQLRGMQEVWDQESAVPREKIIADMVDIGAIISSGLGQMAADLVSGFAQALGEGNLRGFFQNINGIIGEGLVNMGKQLIAFGFAILAFRKALANPVAAIGIGTAMVALGSMFSKSAAGFSSSFGGGGGGGGGRAGSGFSTNTQGQSVRVDGEFIVRGKDLVYVIGQNGKVDGRARSNF